MTKPFHSTMNLGLTCLVVTMIVWKMTNHVVNGFVSIPHSKRMILKTTTPATATFPWMGTINNKDPSSVPFSAPAVTSTTTRIFQKNNDNDEDGGTLLSSSNNDELLLGVAGTLAALITLYSEFTLKTTGCGLPAGPFGLFGLLEGLSYLGVTGLVAYSTVTKIQTGSGLPAGPGGLLGAAEGLSFLAILVGLIVLVFQITNYGYIPNAIPMEGGMCS